MLPFKKCLPLENKTKVKKWITAATNNAYKMGITGVHDAWQDPTTVKVLRELSQKNELPIRVYGMLGSAYP